MLLTSLIFVELVCTLFDVFYMMENKSRHSFDWCCTRRGRIRIISSTAEAKEVCMWQRQYHQQPGIRDKSRVSVAVRVSSIDILKIGTALVQQQPR